MAKTLQDALALIQDPEAKAVLESQLSDFGAKSTRLEALEAQLRNSELVDRGVANGWRKFDSEQKPKIEAELTTLRAEVAKLRPEAERAAALAKQIEGGGGADPKDFMPMVEKTFEGRFLSASDRKAIVEEAVRTASENVKQAVNYGSIPALAGMIEAKMKAKSEFGLEIPIETIGEAVNRYGSVEKAYAGLTEQAAQAKAAADFAAREATYKADIAAAKEEGRVLGLRESETRGYQPEEGGGSGVMPMVVPPTAEAKGVDPTTYNPSDGNLAREAAQLLAKQESAGMYGKIM